MNYCVRFTEDPLDNLLYVLYTVGINGNENVPTSRMSSHTEIAESGSVLWYA